MDRNFYDRMIRSFYAHKMNKNYDLAIGCLELLNERLVEDEKEIAEQDNSDNHYSEENVLLQQIREKLKDIQLNFPDLFPNTEPEKDLEDQDEIDMVTAYVLDRAQSKVDMSMLLDYLSPLNSDFIKFNVLLPVLSSKDSGLITSQVFASILMAGYNIDKEDLSSIITRLTKELSLEMFIYNMGMNLQEQGHDDFYIVGQLSRL
jgi:hypothetical protein